MRPWKLLRPADWTPTSMERVLWRSPDGSEPIRTAEIVTADVDAHHHLISVGGRIFRADKRDVFQHWDRIEDLRQAELEKSEMCEGEKAAQAPRKMCEGEK